MYFVLDSRGCEVPGIVYEIQQDISLDATNLWC